MSNVLTAVFVGNPHRRNFVSRHHGGRGMYFPVRPGNIDELMARDYYELSEQGGLARELDDPDPEADAVLVYTWRKRIVYSKSHRQLDAEIREESMRRVLNWPGLDYGPGQAELVKAVEANAESNTLVEDDDGTGRAR